jgi:hypothetical protein
LAVPPAAIEIALIAVALDLPDMAAHCLPALDLPAILCRHAAAYIVAAVPLPRAPGT